jgi:dTDP-4-amino-4,6-dideoxygalactose transaminase
LAKFVGVKHVIAVCNATIGLELALRACTENMPSTRREVIVPSWTFAASVHAIQAVGLQPVFCDSVFETHLLDVDHVSRLINEKTCAVLAVHLWGQLCSPALEELCKKHSLPLVLDAAHSFACAYDNGRMSGQFGTVEVFSFHATKFFNSIEGGALCTSSAELAANLRLKRNFGFRGYDDVGCWGTNGKMSEITPQWDCRIFLMCPISFAKISPITNSTRNHC